MQKPASVLSLIKLLFSTKPKFFCNFFLSRFPFTDTDNSHDSKGRGGTIFISLWTFRHLFPTLHLKWLLSIFYRITNNYQIVTRWAKPPLRISIWLSIIQVVDLSFHHPGIKSEPTKCVRHLQTFSPIHFEPSVSPLTNKTVNSLFFMQAILVLANIIVPFLSIQGSF